MAYVPHPQHRNIAFAFQKSQWSIPVEYEVNCYFTATTANWNFNQSYWGLHLVAATPSPLGNSQLPDASPLHIAKFVGEIDGDWHGYPVAHWLSPYDKPDQSILKAWLDSGLISKPKMAKIHKGKRCAL